MRISSAIKRAVQISGPKLATDYLDRQQSWNKFGERVAKLAGALVKLGVEPGQRIAMLSLNSDRYLEYFFAVPWAGAVFVPINTRLVAPEFVHWLSDSGSSILFIDDAFLAVWPVIEGQLPNIHTVIYVGDNETPEGMLSYEMLLADTEPIESRDQGGDELAGLLYTGGTTGRSKGVMLSHKNLLINSLQFGPDAGYSAQSIYIHAAPMFHIANGVAMFAVAAMAVSNIIVQTFEPGAVLRAIATKRVNQALLVPTMVNMLVNHADIGKYDLSSLKRVLYGAAPMPEPVIIKAAQKIPAAHFQQAYGQSEAGVILLEPEQHDGIRDMKACGRAILGVELRIHDEDDNELPRGDVGQICLRGDNVMLGYWRLPDLTAETLRNGWLHTGDSGRMDDAGYVTIVDRIKDIIITGGENVYSAEVEDAVHQHEAVAECAAIGIPHDKWGEQVHVIARCHEGLSTTPEELIAHCQKLIAGFKCPRSVEFISDALPLSGAGKILKTELRKPYWQGHDKQVN